MKKNGSLRRNSHSTSTEDGNKKIPADASDFNLFGYEAARCVGIFIVLSTEDGRKCEARLYEQHARTAGRSSIAYAVRLSDIS